MNDGDLLTFQEITQFRHLINKNDDILKVYQNKRHRKKFENWIKNLIFTYGERIFNHE